MKKDKIKTKNGLYSLIAKIDYGNCSIKVTHKPVDKSLPRTTITFVFDEHDTTAELMENVLALRQKCIDHIAVKRSIECKEGLGYI